MQDVFLTEFQIATSLTFVFFFPLGRGKAKDLVTGFIFVVFLFVCFSPVGKFLTETGIAFI